MGMTSRHNILAGLLLLALCGNALAQTVVVVASDDWRDVYAASIYAQEKGYNLRYIQDSRQVRNFIDELLSINPTQVELLARSDGPVPSLGYQLRQQNIDVRDVSYSDHIELAAQLAEKLRSKELILVRDDFAFDALSARYIAYTRNAMILYVRKIHEVPPRTLDAISTLQPDQIFAVGRLDAGVLELLKPFPVKVFNGKDEYATTVLANQYAFEQKKPEQAILTTGDILEVTLLNPRENPVLLVPADGTYSLVQTSDLIKSTGMSTMLGIGQGIATAGYFIKDRTGARIYVKFGSISTGGPDTAFERRDIEMNLQGYRLPQPRYSGRLLNLQADYASSLGRTTGAVLESQRRPAPAVLFAATFENAGNVELPVYGLFTIRDSSGRTITTLKTDTIAVDPQQRLDFKVDWNNPPAEGSYDVEATFFTDVYAGITFPSKVITLDLRWLFVWLSLFLFALVLILLLVMLYYSDRLLRDLREWRTATSHEVKSLEDLLAKVMKMFK